MNSSSPLAARLTAVMHAWPQPINPGCEHHLIQLIDKASHRVVDEGQGFDAARLDEAEANFRTLLTEMTRQAGLLGFSELHEPTLFAALGKLCPIWPFC
jgi:hypothetical protein